MLKKLHTQPTLQQCVDAPENNTSVQKGTSEAATNLKKENSELKKKVRDLETTCGLITYNNEELEVKHETLEKDISSLDDKLEEEYGESRMLKEVIGNVRAEHDELVDTLSDKEGTSKINIKNWTKCRIPIKNTNAMIMKKMQQY